MAENDTENQVEPEAEAETPEPEAASEPEAPVAPGDDAPAEEEPEPAEQPPASEPTEIPAAEPPEEAAEEPAVAEAEPEPDVQAEAAAAQAPGEPPAQPAPKPKRKRLPRIQRRPRARPRRERPKARKPITRLPKPDRERGRRQERRGVVVSSAMDKTIVVKVDTIKAHPRYKKVVRRSTKFHAHDERNEAKVGDVVRIVETRPLSRAKNWKLVQAVVVRTKKAYGRDDGTTIAFDENAAVIIDNQRNPRGTRIFGPVARELREKNFMKIVSLAPEVL